ncbi:Hypothetical_protein [Hexamita inflata]|uniref:Hypothetical_protein n=1 Tax=Hexamita inflata TaxID=28002 RepID=A0AA86PD60_9EUKA|nr:Hypothetical protein HINF_LOCUS24425 [Hexamita inflata]
MQKESDQTPSKFNKTKIAISLFFIVYGFFYVLYAMLSLFQHNEEQIFLLISGLTTCGILNIYFGMNYKILLDPEDLKRKNIVLVSAILDIFMNNIVLIMNEDGIDFQVTEITCRINIVIISVFLCSLAIKKAYDVIMEN